MHIKPKEFGENFYRNTNAQPVQINATTEERFQRQSKNDYDFTGEYNTYKNIALKCHYNRNTNPIEGDSVLSSIAERKICKRERKIKIKYFTGVTIDDMYDCDKPL